MSWEDDLPEVYAELCEQTLEAIRDSLEAIRDLLDAIESLVQTLEDYLDWERSKRILFEQWIRGLCALVELPQGVVQATYDPHLHKGKDIP